MSKRSDSENKTLQNSRIIRVRDLSIHYESKNDDISRNIPQIDNDDHDNRQKSSTMHNLIRLCINRTRQSLQLIWNDNKELRLKIVRGIETSETHAKATIDYICDEQTLLPKVVIVSLAGFGGLLIAPKSGLLRKTFYSSVAATVALGACYPKQSTNFLEQVSARIRTESKGLTYKTNADVSPIVDDKNHGINTVKIENQSNTTEKSDRR